MAQTILKETTTLAKPPASMIDEDQLRADLRVRKVGRFLLYLSPWIGYLFLWIPIVVLVLFSFNNSRTNAIWQGFTLEWYQSLFAGQFGSERNFSTENLLASTERSLIVAFTATTIATILGTMVALGVERFRFRGRRLIELLLYLPIVMPEITMGLSLLLFFSLGFNLARRLAGLNWTLSLTTVIIGHVVFSLPFVAIAVRARLAGMSKSIEEAAQDLGANEWQTFRRITMPLLMPGILAGALLAFTLSLDDFIITLFTQGPGSTTLPLFVYGMIKTQITPNINAISTLMVLVSMAFVMASLFLQNRQNALK